MVNYEELRKKYVERLNNELADKPKLITRQYQEFRANYLPKKLTLYESACNFSEKVLSIDYDKKKINDLNRAIESVHLNVTSKGVASFALLAPMALILSALLIFFIIPIMLGFSGQLFFLIFFLIAGVIIIQPLNNLPFILADGWRMKTSNQMVLCVFYIVTYMRHTSNLELAIDFAAEHLGAPLGLDLKKILWDMETEKYHNISESLDNYLEGWKDNNMEFIESIHLIEGSLLESSESRRLEMLDKSLSVMLDETYEKMLHYAHDLKSPLTSLHMLGVILPILTMVILPLVVGFMSEIKWYHLFMFYNVALPIAVFALGKSMLSKRPSGYGESDNKLKQVSGLFSFKLGSKVYNFGPSMAAIIVFVLLFFAGLFPFAYHVLNPGYDIAYLNDGYFGKIDLLNTDDVANAKFYFLGYRDILDAEGYPTGKKFGPFGVGATIMGLLIPLAFGAAIGIFYKLKSTKTMKIRQATKKLEQEFSGALFQLGNRLADGIPAEIAFSKVANVLQGTQTGKFFEAVSTNISKLGLDVDKAIFDHEHGAIKDYPSPIIESSMKVLIESSKKGPLIASQAIINVSEYIKEMHRVDERLKDLMADVISSMKSQVNFLTPIISAIVIGITSMITKIMGLLSGTINNLDTGDSQVQGQELLGLFGSGGIPTYFFQVVVGLYVVQLAYILTILVSGIENGSDPLNEEYSLGKSMINSTALYCLVSLVIILLFNLIAGNIMDNF